MGVNGSKGCLFNEILVVDDTAAYLKRLSDMLTVEGYSVREASSGELALQSIKAKLPSLILLEIRMPGMDGYEVCRQLKATKSTRDIPVIFISTLKDEASKLRGFEAGCVDYIHKPFREVEVLARVKTHIRLRQMQLNLENQNLLLLNEISERKQAEEQLLREMGLIRQISKSCLIWEQILPLPAPTTKRGPD